MNLHNNFREDIEYLLYLLKDNKPFSLRDMVVKKYIDRGYVPVKFRI